MSELKKVYVVTSGEYSDYGIRAIFSSEEAAERYKDHDNADDVEIWDLDEPHEEWVTTTVRMAKDGSVATGEDGVWTRKWNQDDGFVCFDVKDHLVWAVKTEIREKAIKVTNEKRIKILALWPSLQWKSHMFLGRAYTDKEKERYKQVLEQINTW